MKSFSIDQNSEFCFYASPLQITLHFIMVFFISFCRGAFCA